MISTCAHTKTRSSTSVTPPSPNSPDSASDTGDQPAGHSLMPSAIRDACHSSSVETMPGDHGQDEVGLAEVAALEALRALDLADAERPDHAEQHGHREHVDQQREPALVAEPRQRGVLAHRPDHRDDDRREEDDEAPEDQRVHEPRARAAGTACAGPARSSPRCARARGTSPVRSTGLPSRTRSTSSLARRANRPPQTASAAASATAPASDGYAERAFLSSAVIAGTISVRSPITA